MIELTFCKNVNPAKLSFSCKIVLEITLFSKNIFVC